MTSYHGHCRTNSRGTNLWSFGLRQEVRNPKNAWDPSTGPLLIIWATHHHWDMYMPLSPTPILLKWISHLSTWEVRAGRRITNYLEMPLPVRPYWTPPPFDLDEYKDSFEIWEHRWNLFLAISTIDTALRGTSATEIPGNCASDLPFQSHVGFGPVIGLSPTQLQDPKSIIERLRSRCNAGRNCCVWRKTFAQWTQRSN